MFYLQSNNTVNFEQVLWINKVQTDGFSIENVKNKNLCSRKNSSIKHKFGFSKCPWKAQLSIIDYQFQNTFLNF